MGATKLLYVEDDPVIRENFSTMFMSEGYNVVAVSTTDEALHLIRTRSDLDIAIFDMQLAEDRAAGIALSKTFRGAYPIAPIVLLSSYVDLDLQVEAYQVGADAYIDKKEPLPLILVRVRSLIARLDVLKTEGTKEYAQNADGITFDHDSELVFWNGQRLRLNHIRYKLLLQLNSSPATQSVYDLIQAAQISAESNTIAQHIKLIRSEFCRIDPSFSCIETVRGKGYRWVDVG
ncbi:hypothetical protein A3762_04315 [Oleiphilus sp. HI0125]|uniref:response regulator transcription factor n=1 Tax=Oleiphilus sp. HI0125 TaxID=1822266 RepID=UPI0007C3E350|nr:response regulator transcription factor [Oleiphilus sp. HI0125]KZZ59791.1 hypothetical protein A3762_04315 [Oleiphilus sp. HI0125]